MYYSALVDLLNDDECHNGSIIWMVDVITVPLYGWWMDVIMVPLYGWWMDVIMVPLEEAGMNYPSEELIRRVLFNSIIATNSYDEVLNRRAFSSKEEFH